MTKTLTPQQILSLPIETCRHTEATTVGKYLMTVLSTYCEENRGFDPGEPLGLDGWKVPIRDAFRKAGLIDPDSYATEKHLSEAFNLLLNADWSTLEEYREPEDWFVVYLDLDVNNVPKLVDFYAKGRTEKDAKAKAEEIRQGTNDSRWIAVQLPQHP